MQVNKYGYTAETAKLIENLKEMIEFEKSMGKDADKRQIKKWEDMILDLAGKDMAYTRTVPHSKKQIVRKHKVDRNNNRQITKVYI
jgi:hypothetical protein